MIELKDYDGKKLASARELHEALGIKKYFVDWFKYSAERAMLEEGIDFYTKKGKSTGGRPSMEYLLTKDTAIGIIMMSGGKNAATVRKEVIRAFQERQTGITLDADQVAALTDVVKAMTLVSNQKYAERRHFAYYNHPPTWWEYRASILGYSKESLTKALAEVNKKFTTTKKALMKIDSAEIIRTGTIDLLIALGKTAEYAQNVAEFAKIIAIKNGYDKEIWDDTKEDPLMLNVTTKERQKLLRKNNLA